MTRKEMIDHIVDFAMGYNSFECSTPKEELAEDMLRAVEEQGMLPPVNEEDYHHMDNSDRVLANTVKTIHNWEPEND